VEEAATPAPVRGVRAEARAHGVVEDICAGAVEAFVVVDDARAEAFLEEVSHAAVAAVEPLRVHPVEAVHAGGELLEQALDHEVEVVVEQAERVEQPAEPVLGVDDAADDSDAVVVVAHDVLPRDAADGDVKGGVRRKRRAGAARHVATVARDRRPHPRRR
jgi:hypothetical protein